MYIDQFRAICTAAYRGCVFYQTFHLKQKYSVDQSERNCSFAFLSLILTLHKYTIQKNYRFTKHKNSYSIPISSQWKTEYNEYHPIPLNFYQ